MEKEFVTDCGGIQPKESVTELVFILDKSGSMAGMESDTIGGFNSMIEKQKEEKGKAYVSTVLFSNRSIVLHDRKELEDIEPLTAKDYVVGGGTALLDAIGGAIHHVKNIHKYAREEDVPDKTIFVITTDGMENASREYTSEKVKSMIKEREENDGWEFLFVAANIDAVETARHIGIRSDRAANYSVERGTTAMYCALSKTLREYRRSGSISESWSEEIEATKTSENQSKKTKK